MIDTNIKGLIAVTHMVLPAMMRRNRGHVINLGSVAGIYICIYGRVVSLSKPLLTLPPTHDPGTYPYPGGNVYGGTKAFVRTFSLNLRADLVGTAVRVSCLEPGMCETEFSEVCWVGCFMLKCCVRYWTREAPNPPKTQLAPHVQVRFGGDTTKARSVYERMEPITAEDMAETIHWVATLPAHVNVNTMEARTYACVRPLSHVWFLGPMLRCHPKGSIELTPSANVPIWSTKQVMPVQQAFAGFKVARRPPAPVE